MEFLGTKTFITPPTVSIPKENGQASYNSNFSIDLSLSFATIAARIANTHAIPSSGFNLYLVPFD